MSTRRHNHVVGLKMGEQAMRPVGVRLFICRDHDGYHYPACHRASVIIAKDEVHARELLDKVLISVKLRPFKRCRYVLTEIPLNVWSAELLCDGSM